MQPGTTHIFLPTLCPAGLLGIPPRKGKSRAEVTCDLEPWEKWEGETWGYSDPKRGTEDPDAQCCPVLGLPALGDIAQGQVF